MPSPGLAFLCGTVGFELDMARKEINKTQKQITEKKKVQSRLYLAA